MNIIYSPIFPRICRKPRVKITHCILSAILLYFDMVKSYGIHELRINMNHVEA